MRRKTVKDYIGKNIKYSVMLFITGLLLTACGNNAENRENEQIKIPSESIELSENVTILPDGKTSDTEATVYYEGEDFIKTAFAVGGDRLFIGGSEMNGSDFLGYMKKEECELNFFTVDVPENMRVIEMTVDSQGSCHILWMSVDTQVLNGAEHNIINHEKTYITKVNRDGEAEAIIDVSELFAQEQRRPYCFMTDNEGNYYFENKEEVIKLYPDGSQAERITCKGSVRALGCGKSGDIYYIYADESGAEIICRLEESAVADAGVILPPANAVYSGIAAGTDKELFLYNKDGGVYTYDSYSNTVEQRIAGNALPVSGQNVAGYGFLGDGRLCLMSYENGKTVFSYIPVGK